MSLPGENDERQDDWLARFGFRVSGPEDDAGARDCPMLASGDYSGGVIRRFSGDPESGGAPWPDDPAIEVKPGELAAVLEDGRACGALEPGTYVFKRTRPSGLLDLVWIRTEPVVVNWELGNADSADGVPVGVEGRLSVRVADGLKFLKEAIQGAERLPESELKALITPRAMGVLRAAIPLWPADQLRRKRDVFSQLIRTQLGEKMNEIGLEIVDFRVTNLHLPLDSAAGEDLESAPEEHAPAMKESGSVDEEITRLETRIDELEGRRAEGELSDETCERLLAKLRKKRDNLKSR